MLHGFLSFLLGLLVVVFVASLFLGAVTFIDFVFKKVTRNMPQKVKNWISTIWAVFMFVVGLSSIGWLFYKVGNLILTHF